MPAFDLMKDIPPLDVPTLNYVWDWLWRMNACAKPTNERQRARLNQREEIMELLREIADTAAEGTAC